MTNLAAKAYWNAFTLRHAWGEPSLPFLAPEKIRRIQSRRVREIIRHAWRRVPFYREAMQECGLRPEDFRTAADLARLPLIDSSTVAAEPDRFLSDDYSPSDGLGLQSSGTSGRSKTIHYDARALFLALAHGHRQRDVFARFTGARFGYRELVFIRPGGAATQIRGFYERYSWTPPGLDLQRRLLSPGELSIADTAAEMNRFRPDLLCGYGSYLGPLFREARLQGLELHRPKVIQFGGDGMPESDRRLIEDEFGIPVISTYQAAEALRIGFECERRRGLHVSIDAVAVRVVTDRGTDAAAGESGHLVLSNLVNRGTVLLNYRLGDIVTLGSGSCPCGRSLPLIERVEGRSDDLLRLPDGRVVHGLVAVTALQRVPAVLQIQIVQREPASFLLRAVARPDAVRDAVELVRAFRDGVRLPDPAVEVDVEWTDAIRPGPGGKVRAVVSRLEHFGVVA